MYCGRVGRRRRRPQRLIIGCDLEVTIRVLYLYTKSTVTSTYRVPISRQSPNTGTPTWVQFGGT